LTRPLSPLSLSSVSKVNYPKTMRMRRTLHMTWTVSVHYSNRNAAMAVYSTLLSKNYFLPIFFPVKMNKKMKTELRIVHQERAVQHATQTHSLIRSRHSATQTNARVLRTASRLRDSHLAALLIRSKAKMTKYQSVSNKINTIKGRKWEANSHLQME
jgi:galactokinase